VPSGFLDELYVRLGRRCRLFALSATPAGLLIFTFFDLTNRLSLPAAGRMAHAAGHLSWFLAGLLVLLTFPRQDPLPARLRPLALGFPIVMLLSVDAIHGALLVARGTSAAFSAGTLIHAAVFRLPPPIGRWIYPVQGLLGLGSLALLGPQVNAVEAFPVLFASLAAIAIQHADLQALRHDFDLRQVIAEQAAALAQRNAELQRLDQEKNEFLGIAAHDLKNPLNAIRGYTQLLLEEDVGPEESREVLGKVLRSTQRMFDLVCNLLDVNAIERGEVRPTLSDLSLSELASRVSEPHQRAASAKEQRLVIEAEGPAMARADATLAHQVVDNLVSNAVKYSPRGKRITVRVRAVAQSVRLEVQDEGPGLTAEDRARLFGKFARLSAKPTAGEHSTGLGLSIVKRLAESMHGRVWCESEPGQGATFVLELPAA
jgi:signal transduction histidine kinase